MNNSLIFHQQRIQNDATYAFIIIYQSQRDHTNDSLIDDDPTFDGKLELYFDWILKIENKPEVTKYNQSELALGKATGAVIKCLKSLPSDVSWNNEKAILRRQYSLASIVTHAYVVHAWIPTEERKFTGV